ncbi:YrdB family protein [Cryobacterium arcticum]|uniref:4-amino-4-deoxy-L-arabinose transferase n=1 Tax=Cryobacterium arcticum TaxID=670052 RepID=A0A317ZUY2_9MICO|nr:YrdB family protein [Cryobacterium arcticum]PXA68565.1 4-amino-4-deoxy-L-arabinose transferase [Cryobacterium arcticum]
MNDTPAAPTIGANDILRFLLELFAFVSLALWGFLAWPLPWPGVLVGILAPAFAILVWALFRSPKAVFKLDPFGKAIVEIFVFGAAALAWWDLGQPIVAGVFAIIATVSGVLSGRKKLSN